MTCLHTPPDHAWRHATRAGGSLVCRLRPDALVAMAVPSGCRVMVHPHRWITKGCPAAAARSAAGSPLGPDRTLAAIASSEFRSSPFDGVPRDGEATEFARL